MKTAAQRISPRDYVIMALDCRATAIAAFDAGAPAVCECYMINARRFTARARHIEEVERTYGPGAKLQFAAA